MKKTVAIVLLLTFVTVFFCSSVFGATNTVGGRKSTSKQVSNVTVILDLDQLGHTNCGNGDGMAYTPFFVTMRVWNNNTQPALVDSLKFRINVASSTQILDVENFSPDLTVGYYNGTQFQVSPSNDYSYGGGVVVPPKESLYLVCMIYVQDISSNGVNAPSTISSAEIPDFTVGLSNSYPYGTPVDFSPIISYLNNFETYQSNLDEAVEAISTTISTFYQRNHNDIADIEGQIGNIYGLIDSISTKLTNVLNQITWTGTYVSPSLGGSKQVISLDPVTGVNVQIIALTSVPHSDLEVLPPNVTVSDVIYEIPIIIEVYTDFNNTKKYDGTFSLSPLFDYRTYTVVDEDIHSDWIETVTYGGGNYCNLRFRSRDNIIPEGITFSSIRLTLYSRNSTITFNNPVVTLSLNDYESDVESQSDSLINQSNQAHSQEQAFFNQNSQAIANSGLGNYQFSVNQQSGISVVTGLFNRLWSSVGSWNTVYVFSLTITVALTILRYTTNAIRRRSYTDDKGGKP